MSNEKYLDSFLKYLKIELNLSENTVNSYEIDIKQFSNLTKKDFKDILSSDVEIYLQYLHDNYKPATHSRKITALRKFYKFLNFNYKIENIFKYITNPKKGMKIPTYFSKEVLFNFLDSIPNDSVLDKRDKAMFELLYATGMRISEIINLKISNLKFSEKFIIVVGKGNKERIIPVNDQAINHVNNYLKVRVLLQKKTNDILFLNSRGDKLTRQGFDKVLKKRAKNVGITNISAHKFRHSIATHLLDGGADLVMIQNFLGHKNISTTEIYTHVSKQKLKEEYESNLDLDF